MVFVGFGGDRCQLPFVCPLAVGGRGRWLLADTAGAAAVQSFAAMRRQGALVAFADATADAVDARTLAARPVGVAWRTLPDAGFRECFVTLVRRQLTAVVACR